MIVLMMARGAIVLVIVTLVGLAVSTVPNATSNTHTPISGLKPTLIIDRIPSVHVQEADWKIYKLPAAAPANGENRCVEAAKVATNLFELIHEQNSAEPGTLITLKERLGTVCIAATFSTPETSPAHQTRYWTGLYDFTVLDEQIAELSFNFRFYETPVAWGHKYGEEIGSKAPYTIESIAKDIDNNPLFTLDAIGDGNRYALPEQHCFTAKASYRFAGSSNKHLGAQEASAILMGGRTTNCTDSTDQTAKLQFKLGRIDVASFATSDLFSRQDTGFYPFQLRYVFYPLTKSVVAPQEKPLVVKVENGDTNAIFLSPGDYRLAVRFDPSDENQSTPKFIEVPAIAKLKINSGELFSPSPQQIDLAVGGVALEWAPDSNGEIEYMVYREEQFLISGQPTNVPIVRIKTGGKKIDTILPKGSYRIFSSVDGVNASEFVKVEIGKGTLTPESAKFRVKAALVRFMFSNVAGDVQYAPKSWRVYSDEQGREFLLKHEQAVGGIWMAPGKYKVEVPWRQNIYGAHFEIDGPEPQNRTVEIVNWDR